MCAAQNPPTPPPATTVTPKTPYDSTKAQLAAEREKTLSLTNQILSDNFNKQTNEERQQYAAQDKILTDWVIQVRKDNGWDDSYTYNSNGDTWTHIQKAPVKPEVKPEVKPATKESPKAKTEPKT
jgi:hypothetical protein